MLQKSAEISPPRFPQKQYKDLEQEKYRLEPSSSNRKEESKVIKRDICLCLKTDGLCAAQSQYSRKFLLIYLTCLICFTYLTNIFDKYGDSSAYTILKSKTIEKEKTITCLLRTYHWTLKRSFPETNRF